MPGRWKTSVMKRAPSACGDDPAVPADGPGLAETPSLTPASCDAIPDPDADPDADADADPCDPPPAPLLDEAAMPAVSTWPETASPASVSGCSPSMPMTPTPVASPSPTTGSPSLPPPDAGSDA